MQTSQFAVVKGQNWRLLLVIDTGVRGRRMEQITIELGRAPDDPPVNEPQFQEELREFSKLLRAAGLPYSQRGAVGYSQPEFFVTFSPALGATFAMILVTWLQRRAGRTVRASIVGDEIDVQTAKDVEGLLEKIGQIQKNKTPKGEDGS